MGDVWFGLPQGAHWGFKLVGFQCPADSLASLLCMLNVMEPGGRHLSGLFFFLTLQESLQVYEHENLHWFPDGVFLAESPRVYNGFP